MQTRDFIITCADGYALSATLWLPEKDTGSIIQFHNGTGIPATLYHNFWTQLVEQGHIVISFDYRGMGRSLHGPLAQSEARLTDWAYQDMTAVFEWVRENYPHHFKVLMGHSMGGQLLGMMENARYADLLVMIAASTGYWKDMFPPFKWFTALSWNLLVPLTNAIWGYAKASLFGRGDDLPREVANQWKRWCTAPTYFEVGFEEELSRRYHDSLKTKLLSVRVSDDPIANDVTVEKMLTYYKWNDIERWRFTPESQGEKKLGHSGFFSRKMKKSFWEPLVTYLDQQLEVTKRPQIT